jgi:hypothetical protein
MTVRRPAGRREFLATDETRMRPKAVRGAGGRAGFLGRTAVFLNSELRIGNAESESGFISHRNQEPSTRPSSPPTTSAIRGGPARSSGRMRISGCGGNTPPSRAG